MPSFLTDILSQLGWSDGTFLPVSNEENKSLEILLEERNKELVQLKSETDVQSTKQNELDQHRKNLLSEHQTNMHLLVVHKEQMDNEDHLSRLAANESGRIGREVETMDKECQEINNRAERLQTDIARVLRRVESRRTGIGEDRNSLEEWRSALKRGEADIDAIEKFSKEDTAKVAMLDGKRQRLKMEYDKKQVAVSQLCCDLLTEEKTAERMSHQVEEALIQRRRTVATWAGAVENLRQRDKDIKQMQQELEMLREFIGKRGEQMKEKQDFLSGQQNNNAEAETELADLKEQLAQERMRLAKLHDLVKTLNDECICIKRELMSSATQLTNYRLNNKTLNKEKDSKEDTIQSLQDQIQNYKEKLAEVMDGSKTAAQRTRQLEDMLASEERYMRHLTAENDRLQHCIFRLQQHLAALKEEENLIKLTTKSYKIAVGQMEIKQVKLEKELLTHKEILYKVGYTLEKVLARIGRLEGTRVDPVEEELLEQRAAQLVPVGAERVAALQQLNSQLVHLGCEERLLTQGIHSNQGQHELMKERMKELMASGDGAVRCVQTARKEGRARRAEEGTLRLRAAHAERALQRLGDRSLSLEKAGLGLKAAVSERAAEARERLAVLRAQRRVLQEERGSLAGDLKSEQLQVEQLIKKYDICISTMGKDEDGQTLSVTYFMIKNAQEKSELQQEGDALDAQIRKSEKEIAALEATLHVVDTANRNYIRNLAPPQDDDPEVLELAALTQEFHRAREQRSQLLTRCGRQSKQVDTLRNDIASLAPQIEALETIREGLLDDLAILERDLKEQQDKLSRATAQCKKAQAAARRKIKDSREWAMYETDIQWRALSDANRSAAAQLLALQLPEVEERAQLQGINLTMIHSGPLTSKKMGSVSGRSSNISSDQVSPALRSVCECTSVTSSSKGGLSLISPASSGIRDKLQAARAPRSPLSETQENSPTSKGSSMSRSQSKQSPGGGSMPLSVVMLGLDSGPVKGPSSQVTSKSIPSKMKPGSKSSTSNK